MSLFAWMLLWKPCMPNRGSLLRPRNGWCSMAHGCNPFSRSQLLVRIYQQSMMGMERSGWMDEEMTTYRWMNYGWCSNRMDGFWYDDNLCIFNMPIDDTCQHGNGEKWKAERENAIPMLEWIQSFWRMCRVSFAFCVLVLVQHGFSQDHQSCWCTAYHRIRAHCCPSSCWLGEQRSRVEEGSSSSPNHCC